jgi:hypothetical protein
MSERAELICRLMVELGAEFEGFAEATTRQQRTEQLDANSISAIANHARVAASIAEVAVLLAEASSRGLDLVRR